MLAVFGLFVQAVLFGVQLYTVVKLYPMTDGLTTLGLMFLGLWSLRSLTTDFPDNLAMTYSYFQQKRVS